MRLEPPTLCGRFVALEPLSLNMADELVAAANEDRSTYDWTMVPDTVEAMERYIRVLLDEQQAGTASPFAQRRTNDGKLVGCTRYLRLEWWGGRTVPDEVEIGGTWLASSAQRTPINTEAKLLLLGHAFEALEVQRVSICTDSRNAQSRRAIERLGATFEGILRSHRGSYLAAERNVVARDSAMYSVVRAEWPAMKQSLSQRLAVG